jgi:ABC-type transporter Mla subunit MlaD
MADVPPQGPAAPSVQALLDALDARSRAQAEDAAGRLLGHALDRVGEALASIEQRLGTLEQRGDNAAVFTQVVELGARLERFEQAFYRAVSEGGDGSDVVRNIETVVRQGTADYVRAVDSLRERQQAELGELRATLEEVVRSELHAAAPEPAQAEPVDLTPLIVRLDEVSAKIQRPTTDAMRELAERLESQVDRLHESFPRLNELRQSWKEELGPVAERLQGVEDAISRTADVPADLPEVATRMEGAVERLSGLEAQLRERDDMLAQLDGRMEGLESRVRTHLAGLTERVEGVMGAITSSTSKGDASGRLEQLADGIGQLERAINDLRERAERTEQASGSDRATLEQLQHDVRSAPTVDAIASRLEEIIASQPAPEFPAPIAPPRADEIAERVVASLPAPPEPPAPPVVPSADDTAAKVKDVLHREFELLTQRVASMSASLEATRTLLDQHVEDTAQSLGRRASEVGRKLAADLGFRPRKDERRDPRELNRGGH